MAFVDPPNNIINHSENVHFSVFETDAKLFNIREEKKKKNSYRSVGLDCDGFESAVSVFRIKRSDVKKAMKQLGRNAASI